MNIQDILDGKSQEQINEKMNKFFYEKDWYPDEGSVTGPFVPGQAYQPINGLPAGGEAGQCLVKSSDKDYETVWKDFPEETDPIFKRSAAYGITSSDIENWNNTSGGSSFSGDYNDLTNKPDIPDSTSDLVNDSGFITSIPEEYVTESELNQKGYLTSIPEEYKTKSENDDLYQPKGNYLTTIPEEYVTEEELNSKGYITQIPEESDPTVPAHVKAITQADIDNWNNGTGGGSVILNKNIITISTNGTPTIASGDTLPLNKTVSVTGDKLTHDKENYQIVIGPGVTKVKLSFTVNGRSSSRQWYAICRTRDGISGKIGMDTIGKSGADQYTTLCMTDKILDVLEGDRYWIKSFNTGSAALNADTGSGGGTYMTMEVVEPSGASSGGGSAYTPQIGDVLITSTNVGVEEMATRYGGEWELIDKGFKSAKGTNGYSRNTTNCTEITQFHWTRSGHSITLNIRFTNKVQIADEALTMFTVNYEVLGITRMTYNYYGVFWSDLAQCLGFFTLTATSANFNTVDIIPDNYISAGRTDNSAAISFNVPMEYMLDSACDKFYWKRIA